MQFGRFIERRGYKAKSGESIGYLKEEILVPMELSLLLWCGTDNRSRERFPSSDEY